MSAAFGSPNPGVALPPPASLTEKSGPLHRVELVIEIVGPKSMPAKSVAALLQPDWFRALGEPRMWVMAPSGHNLATSYGCDRRFV